MSKGWRLVKLSDVCEIQRGGSPRPISDYITDADDGINWIKIGDVAEGAKYLYTTKEKIKPEGAKRSREVKSGDFLLSNSMSFGRPYILRTSGCIHDGWLVLRDKEGQLNEDYLYHVLGSDFVYAQFKKFAVGAVVKNLNIEVVEKVEIPLPSLPEQVRIAAILDKADALRVKRREALAQLDSLTQAIFIDMFGDPVSNPKGWGVSKLGSAVELIQIGPFGTQLHEEDYVEDGVPLVNPTHIKNGKIFPDHTLTVSEAKYKQLSQYHLAAGDLILGRRGEMGRCAVVTTRENGWLCGTGSLFIRPNGDLLTSTYLDYVISSASMKRHLENVAQGVTMANLNKDIVGNLPIPTPPIQLQNDFSAGISVVEKLKAAQQKSLIELDNLIASLQHRAFRGEL